jgi:hypothetical protein
VDKKRISVYFLDNRRRIHAEKPIARGNEGTNPESSISPCSCLIRLPAHRPRPRQA